METPRGLHRENVNEQIKYLERLGYRQRRYALWRLNKPRLPHHIYKFRAFDAGNSTSIERLRDILLQCRLRLASPREFNDPFDMKVKIVVEGTQAEIRRRIAVAYRQRGLKWAARQREVAHAMRNFTEEVALKAQTSFRDTISAAGVCSFGGDPRSILMWSHYADCHRGVCLQFEIARDLTTFAQALPVNYSEDYPVLNWVQKGDDPQSITAVLLRKYIGWDYEQESRIIIEEGAGRFINFRPVALSRIIIGSSASEETVEQLKEIIAERTSRAMPVPKLYRAFTDEGKFRLNIKSLS